MSDALPRLTTALASHYRIERELGAGGMATVYLARDLKHDREVALKVLRPELAAVLGAERFLQEIRISAKLDHPHILTLIDSGAADGFLYYVLPFVRGESLREKGAGSVRLSSQFVMQHGSAPRLAGELALDQAEVEPPLLEPIFRCFEQAFVGPDCGDHPPRTASISRYAGLPLPARHRRDPLLQLFHGQLQYLGILADRSLDRFLLLRREPEPD